MFSFDFENNPWPLYKRIIDENPLLEHDEEVALAKMIEKGKRADKRLENLKVEPGKELSDADLKKKKNLERVSAKAKEARSKLWKSNLRLVISIAKRWRRRFRTLTSFDVIEEGQKGLARAIDKFEHKRGLRFSTYASGWIRQAISAALVNQDSFVRIPVHVAEDFEKFWLTKNRLLKEGKEPLFEEIASLMGEPTEKIRRMVALVERARHGRVNPAADDCDNLCLETAPGKDDVLVLAERSDLAQHILDCLDLLSEREREIVFKRFLDERPLNLRQIGEQLGLTKERVRQVQDRALEKLGKMPQIRMLADFG